MSTFLKGPSWISRRLLLLILFFCFAPSSYGIEGKGGIEEEDDFSTTPFLEYGDFSESAEEEESTRFFQYGRFFGISLGIGYQGATGNRGALWEGGFPLLDGRLHYWFDFNLALQMGFYHVNHSYSSTSQGGRTEVSFNRLGVDLKYYFDTKDLSSAISFANPYVLAGVGSFSKTETPPNSSSRTTDSKFGTTFGAGFEFVVKPRRTYFNIEARYHIVRFSDSNTSNFNSDGYPDLEGNFYNIVFAMLFTW